MREKLFYRCQFLPEKSQINAYRKAEWIFHHNLDFCCELIILFS